MDSTPFESQHDIAIAPTAYYSVRCEQLAIKVGEYLNRNYSQIQSYAIRLSEIQERDK